MGFSLKKIGKSITNAAKSLTHGNILKNAASVGAAIMTNGASLQYDPNAQERLGSAITNLFGGDSSVADSFLSAFNGAYSATSGTSSPLSGINWGNSVFSAKQAKEMAKWNSELNYQYQTQLNNQGFTHDQEMLKMQQDYDTNMANTAVQRRAADLKAANINPIHAADLDAGGGGLGGGSGLSGGTAQTSKADWLGLKLQQLAAERDAQRVQIEQANSASSGALMAAQEQNTLAQMAETIEKLPGVKRKQEAEIGNLLAGTVKTRAETAKSIAETQKVQQGRWAEMGLKIGQQAVDFFNPPKGKDTVDGKKLHWYGVRKDGK